MLNPAETNISFQMSVSRHRRRDLEIDPQNSITGIQNHVALRSRFVSSVWLNLIIGDSQLEGGNNIIFLNSLNENSLTPKESY